MFELSAEHLAVQEQVRAFAQREIEPIVKEIDETGRFPSDIVAKLGAEGYLGHPLPKKYGGTGKGYLAAAVTYEEIGRVCSSIRGFIAVQLGLVSMCIHDWGTEEQKQRYLPRLTAGKIIGCYSLTEKNAGSDVANMETVATPDGDHFVINGQKVWITNANFADVAILFASVDRSKRHRGITAFLIEKGTPGFNPAHQKYKSLGHRAMDHGTINLQNCRVHKSQVLGEVGGGFRVAMGALDHGRLGVAAGCLGVAQACLDACVKFANARVQFGQPIAEFQMIQKTIADIAVETEAARLLTYRAAAQKDAGKKNTRETSMAKLYASEAASRAASNAVTLHGSYGYSNENPVERYYRDIKGSEIYEGTSYIQRIIIARDALGIRKLNQ
ncbi:MAG: acyl-CoA dehydrogenase family protein [Candidatus Tectomicrobia bacterium]|nr:acyl-CoA dehydrogenase family protein [Candidatus Tectomicrobia bacterium]